MPAQSMCVQGSSCTYSGDLDPMHVSPAFQAEENVAEEQRRHDAMFPALI